MAATILISAGVAIASSALSAALTPRPPAIGTLDDLAVQRSELGVSIPKIYGRYRVPANVVWSTDLQKFSKSGGSSFFGLKKNADEVDYRVNLVAVIAQRCQGLGRVWLGQTFVGNLSDGVYADSEGNDGNHGRIAGTRYASNIIGTFGNLNNTTAYQPIRDWEGSGNNYPALIDTATLQIHQLYVSQRFGGQIPPIEVEVIGQQVDPTLDWVVRDVLTIAGVDPSLIDVGVLSDSVIHGARLNYDGGGISDFLEELARVHLFNLYEDNETGKITAAYDGRLGTPIVLSEKDLFAKEYGSDQITGISETKAQPTELPTSVEITYPNQSNRYKTGTQKIQSAVAEHVNEIKIATDLVLTDAEATLTVKAIFESYQRQKSSYSGIVTNLDYANIGIGEAVRFPLENRQIFAKITKKAIGVNGLVEFDAISIDGDVDAFIDVISDDDRYADFDNIPDLQLKPILLDLPRLDVIDGDVIFYYNAIDDPEVNYFTSGDLVLDTAQTGITTADQLFSLGTIGGLVTNIPSGTADYNSPNLEIEIQLDQGTLEPNDFLGFYRNECMLYINGELLGYQYALVQPNGNYILSNISRGLQGTEQAIASHQTGDTVYLVKSKTLTDWKPVVYNKDLIGSPVTSWIVADGGDLADTVLSDNDVLGGESVRPYAPCNLNVEYNPGLPGIRFTWDRRGRADDYMRDNTSDILELEGAPIFKYRVLYNGNLIAELGTTLQSGVITSAQITAAGAGVGFALTYEISEYGAKFGDFGKTLIRTQKYNKLVT